MVMRGVQATIMDGVNRKRSSPGGVISSQEDQIVSRIVRALARRGGSRRFRIGPGDDAAVLLPARAGVEQVITCDAFLENVHFLANVHSAETAGYKALARATSDLAAMGAAPEWFLLSLALPANRTGAWLDEFLRGMARAARRFRLALAGGDTSQNATVAVSITVCGSVPRGDAILRSTARPGDKIFVSGRLGAAQLGLELVLRGMYRNGKWKPLLATHLEPPVRLELGRWLASRRLASAMMDLSDGLSLDLARLCAASGVGARIDAQRVPSVRVPASLAEHGFALTKDTSASFRATELALHGGDDYELLFTVPPRLAAKIPRSHRGVPLTEIGVITRPRGIILASPSGDAPLTPRAWDHFR